MDFFDIISYFVKSLMFTGFLTICYSLITWKIALLFSCVIIEVVLFLCLYLLFVFYAKSEEDKAWRFDRGWGG